LRNAVKAGADERFAGDPVYLASKRSLRLVCAKFPDIARRIAAAARCGFRGGNFSQRGEPVPAEGGDQAALCRRCRPSDGS
jgi:hypothetical protein